MITITVIIPCYNGRTRGFLDEAIESVLNQTRPPDRFILIDDGSKDGSADYVREKYPSVEVITKPNGGLASVRNLAIDQLETEYLCFLDDDDVWEKDKLLEQERYLHQHPDTDLIFTGVTYIDATGKTLNVQQPVDYGHTYPEVLMGNTFLPPSTVIFSRRLVKEVGHFDPTLKIEDYDYMIRSTRVGKVGHVDLPLVRYRRHGFQMAQNYKRTKSTLYIEQYNSEMIELHSEGLDEGLRARLQDYFVTGLICRSIIRRDHPSLKYAMSRISSGWRLIWCTWRAFGMALGPLTELKEKWRKWEYSFVLKN